MLKPSKSPTLSLAVELGFLDEQQRQKILAEAKDSKSTKIEIAVRKGLLTGHELRVLESFEAPDEVAPGYQVDGFIGKGGAGVVFLATQLALNRPVALKTISKSFLGKNEIAIKRFEREAKIVGQLKHPNIVSAVDFGVHKDQLYLVMEFIEGKDAEKYLSSFDTLPEIHAWHIARQVCHGLSYASELGIIHRDIKPANLILTASPRGSGIPAQVPFVKIADFGLARFKEQPTEGNITLESAVNGTPFYMSPEQASGEELDHRSDIYSLGITIWHLITGCPPISGTSPMDVVNNKINQEDDWFDDAADGVSPFGLELLKKMCRYERADRTGDYTELVSEIDRVIERLGGESQISETINLTAESDRFIPSANVTFVEGMQRLGPMARTTDFGDELGKPTMVKWLLPLVALPVVAALLAIMFWRPATSGENSDPAYGEAGTAAKEMEFAALSETTGPPIFLFDGLKFDPRQKFSGLWDVAKGGEGESVLAGNGTRDFKCVDEERQPLGYFRFECGFRHQESKRIDFRCLDSDGAPFFQISVLPNRSVLSSGEVEVGSTELEGFDEASFGYHNIQIESQPKHWRASVDGQLLGVIPKPEDAQRDTTVQLSVDGQGVAHFEGIRFWRLFNPSQDN